MKRLATAQSTCWNICCDHRPSFAGLYRAVEDFRQATDGGVLSFDTSCISLNPRRFVDHDCGVLRVPCGSVWPWCGCHLVAKRQAALADRLAANAGRLIVHSLFRGHAIWAEGWARRFRRSYWAVPHGCLDPWGLRHRYLMKQCWLRTAGQRYLAHAQRVIFATHRERAKAAPWVRASQSIVVPWPVEVPQSRLPTESRETLRERFGVPPESRILLYAARLHSMKRPVETIKAFSSVQAPRLHLVMAGAAGDIDHAALEQTIPQSAKDRVHLVGELDRLALAAAYQAADGFISLSWRENFGYSAADALASALPIIVSPGHDLAHEMPRDISGGITCGWLLQDNSMRGAIEAIQQFADIDEASVERMGDAGRSWVNDALSPARFHDKLTAMAASD